jgi:hypothetical protein
VKQHVEQGLQDRAQNREPGARGAGARSLTSGEGTGGCRSGGSPAARAGRPLPRRRRRGGGGGRWRAPWSDSVGSVVAVAVAPCCVLVLRFGGHLR